MKKLKALSIVLAVALVVSTISVSPAGAKEKPYKPVPVSYTHLDVYKRQELRL